MRFKRLSLLLCAALLFALSGCGESPGVLASADGACQAVFQIDGYRDGALRGRVRVTVAQPEPTPGGGEAQPDGQALLAQFTPVLHYKGADRPLPASSASARCENGTATLTWDFSAVFYDAPERDDTVSFFVPGLAGEYTWEFR